MQAGARADLRAALGVDRTGEMAECVVGMGLGGLASRAERAAGLQLNTSKAAG